MHFLKGFLGACLIEIFEQKYSLAGKYSPSVTNGCPINLMKSHSHYAIKHAVNTPGRQIYVFALDSDSHVSSSGEPALTCCLSLWVELSVIPDSSKANSCSSKKQQRYRAFGCFFTNTILGRNGLYSLCKNSFFLTRGGYFYFSFGGAVDGETQGYSTFLLFHYF